MKPIEQFRRSAFGTDEANGEPYKAAETEETHVVGPDEHEAGAHEDEITEDPSEGPMFITEGNSLYEAEGTEIEAVKVWRLLLAQARYSR